MDSRDDLTLHTGRLVLRPMTDRDANEWWEAVWSDADVTRFLPTREPIPLEAMPARMDRVREHWRTHDLGLWSVREESSSSLVGHCGLVVNEPPDVELIYALARSAWGRGLASEAARAMVAFGFERRGLPELFALVFPENTASVHVLDKLGFSLNDTTVRFGAELLRYVRRNDRASARAG